MPTQRILIALAAIVVIGLTAAFALWPRTEPASAGIPTLLGDVSCDGGISIADAQLIAQLIVGRISALDCPENGDVDEDGGISIADAQLIAQLIVGRISSLPPTPPPGELSGVGQQATNIFHLAEGLTIFRMTHTGSSNFIIWLLDGTGAMIELLVNEIGPFDGATAVGLDRSGDYLLDVNADGSWSVTIEQPRNVQGQPPPPQITGQGQQVSQLLALQGGLAQIQMTHDGQSNFIIWLLRDDGSIVDLLVNEIGPFDGSTALQIPGDGTYILDITADGNWTISINQ